MATTITEHYRAYAPRPFTRAERDSVTVLFGGLHWRVERVIQAVLENGGNRAEVLPIATREDLLTGREVADIGQCCPTSFTTGNLVNFVKRKSQEHGVEETAKRYVYLTAGACGACRFGQYHQSYKLGLRNAGLGAFRMFLLAQDDLAQSSVMGGGLNLDTPDDARLPLGDLLHGPRPGSRVPGAAVRGCRRSNRRRRQGERRVPLRPLPQPAAARPVADGRPGTSRPPVSRGRSARSTEKFSAIEVDRLRVKPSVKITGEFYLQTVEGDPNYNIHRWLEAEGAQVYPAAIAVWMDYLLRLGLQTFEDYSGIERGARLKLGAGRVVQAIYRWNYNRLRRALGNLPHELPGSVRARRLAAPYFHSRLDGGEGDMLVGKALWAYLHKKAHMICELSPYACMPNTMSVGAMAGVIGKYPDLLYAPLEIKGDAEVHALSRCQMILTEARKRAQREFEDALVSTGLDHDRGARLPRRPPGDEARHLSGAAGQRRRDSGESNPARRQAHRPESSTRVS